MTIHVNRILNMKHIKAIGFDMDHTLVRYHTEKFEELTFNETIKKLLQDKNYPKEIESFSFDFKKSIRGLIIDKEHGNILKVSLYNRIKTAHHGTRVLSHKEKNKLYSGASIDIREDIYTSVDTAFSIAYTVIFSQLVDLKDSNPKLELPPYSEMADDVLFAVDMAHRDGSLKEKVKKNLKDYVIQDKEIVECLEKFRRHGKKLWIITNSEYSYTKALLDYTINPFLEHHEDWSDLFEITVTLAAKPRFFTDKLGFLKVQQDNGLLSNYDGKIKKGIYQGGYAIKLQNDLNLSGGEILYLGDHIYGDILKLKKACDWRTALVIEELQQEVDSYRENKQVNKKFAQLMQQKQEIEDQINELYDQQIDSGTKVDKKVVDKYFSEIEHIDTELAELIKSHEAQFNENWGEVMRAGAEPSFFAEQIERYACIYMTKISDFKNYSPRTYFRPKKRLMAHELD